MNPSCRWRERHATAPLGRAGSHDRQRLRRGCPNVRPGASRMLRQGETGLERSRSDGRVVQ